MDLATVEADFAAAATRVEHAAAWLLGMAVLTRTDLRTLEAQSPLVKDAIVAGEAAAEAHGVPVVAIVTGADAVLSLAQQLAATLAATTPAAKA